MKWLEEAKKELNSLFEKPEKKVPFKEVSITELIHNATKEHVAFGTVAPYTGVSYTASNIMFTGFDQQRSKS